MTTKLTTFEEEKLREFDKTIQQRTMDKDNPQYVLGWNTCRYLSRDFLCQALRQQREMMREDKSSDFSKFFRGASSGEKKKVFLDVAKRASKEQREMIRKEVEKLEGKPIHYLDILSLLSDKEKGDGSVRCCDNGDMDERHECLKSNRK